MRLNHAYSCINYTSFVFQIKFEIKIKFNTHLPIDDIPPTERAPSFFTAAIENKYAALAVHVRIATARHDAQSFF